MAAKRILPPSNRALSGAVFFTVKNASERAILTFEWDATGAFENDSRIVTSDREVRNAALSLFASHPMDGSSPSHAGRD